VRAFFDVWLHPCQAEAFHGCGQWVNYFFHFGHLHIKGLKMAKSLKNFITIRQALAGLGRNGARRIRLMFLLQPWDKPIDYSDQVALHPPPPIYIYICPSI